MATDSPNPLQSSKQFMCFSCGRISPCKGCGDVPVEDILPPIFSFYFVYNFPRSLADSVLPFLLKRGLFPKITFRIKNLHPVSFLQKHMFVKTEFDFFRTKKPAPNIVFSKNTCLLKTEFDFFRKKKPAPKIDFSKRTFLWST